MKTILSSIFLFLPILIFGQSNYHQGYVVKNTGDTIKGYVNYHDWTYTPKSITFKTDLVNKETINYTSQDIKSFQINGFEEYISFNGLVSTNKNIFPNYPTSLDTNREIRLVFLKKLITGKNVNLYVNNENDKNRFFVAEGNGQLVELKYYPYYLEESNAIKYNKLFIGQLMLLFNKYNPGKENLFTKFKEIQFEENEIENVVIQINGGIYSNSKKNQPDNFSKKHFNFYVGAGLNLINTKYLPNTPYSTITKTTGPRIEIGADYFIKPDLQDIVLRAEISVYSKYKTGPNFNQIVGSFTPQILYNIYYGPNFKFYVDAGVRFNYSTAQKITYVYFINDFPQYINLYHYDADNHFKWVSFPLQTGFVLKNRYEVFFSYTGYRFINPYISQQILNLGVKYMLKKPIK